MSGDGDVACVASLRLATAIATDLRCLSRSATTPKALQNTGLPDFRQSHFVDTPYTLGYTSWFLFGRSGELSSVESCGNWLILRADGDEGA